MLQSWSSNRGHISLSIMFTFYVYLNLLVTILNLYVRLVRGKRREFYDRMIEFCSCRIDNWKMWLQFPTSRTHLGNKQTYTSSPNLQTDGSIDATILGRRTWRVLKALMCLSVMGWMERECHSPLYLWLYAGRPEYESVSSIPLSSFCNFAWNTAKHWICVCHKSIIYFTYNFGEACWMTERQSDRWWQIYFKMTFDVYIIWPFFGFF